MRGRLVAVVSCTAVALLGVVLVVPVERAVQLAPPPSGDELRHVDRVHARVLTETLAAERAYRARRFARRRPYWTGAISRDSGIRVVPIWNRRPWQAEMTTIPHLAEPRREWSGEFVIWRIVIVEVILVLLLSGALAAFVTWGDRRRWPLRDLLPDFGFERLARRTSRDPIFAIAVINGCCGVYSAFCAAGNGTVAFLWDTLEVHWPWRGGPPEGVNALIAIAMAATTILLAAACRVGLNASRDNDRRRRLSLALGSCGVIGPIVVLYAMGVHGAPRVQLVFNGAGTLALLAINAIPLAFYGRLARRAERTNTQAEAPAVGGVPSG